MNATNTTSQDLGQAFCYEDPVEELVAQTEAFLDHDGFGDWLFGDAPIAELMHWVDDFATALLPPLEAVVGAAAGASVAVARAALGKDGLDAVVDAFATLLSWRREAQGGVGR